MKILVLNGSPKKEKSDTMNITRAFLDGMSEVAEQKITQIDVIDANIGYCRGCFTCKRTGGECVLYDDMRGILDKILHSDLLIFSFLWYARAAQSVA